MRDTSESSATAVLAAEPTSFAALAVVDAHVHLWDTTLLRYDWLEHGSASTLPRIADSSLFASASAELSDEATVVAAVVVQAECHPDQARDELNLILAARAAGAPVAGIVAYAGLEKATAAQALEHLATLPEVRGVRRNIQDTEPGFCKRLAPGVSLLTDYGLSFDICVRQHQLREVIELVDAAPRTSFVLDHLGKPAVGAASQQWQHDIAELAERPGVCCKLSGLGTEAPTGWSSADVAPYLRHAIDVFGPQRVMFGSDWPVCTAAGTYGGWIDTVRSVVPATHHKEVFEQNAIRFYRL